MLNPNNEKAFATNRLIYLECDSKNAGNRHFVGDEITGTKNYIYMWGITIHSEGKIPYVEFRTLPWQT